MPQHGLHTQCPYSTLHCLAGLSVQQSNADNSRCVQPLLQLQCGQRCALDEQQQLPSIAGCPTLPGHRKLASSARPPRAPRRVSFLRRTLPRPTALAALWMVCCSSSSSDIMPAAATDTRFLTLNPLNPQQAITHKAIIQRSTRSTSWGLSHPRLGTKNRAELVALQACPAPAPMACAIEIFLRRLHIANRLHCIFRVSVQRLWAADRRMLGWPWCV